MKFKIKLRIASPDGKRHKFSMNLEDKAKFALGRATPALGLEDESVAPTHCLLWIENNELHVEDNSGSGLRINNHDTKNAALHIGDILQIGVYSIEVLEAPVPPKENQAATQFIDIAELSAADAKALKISRPSYPEIPEVPAMPISEPVTPQLKPQPKKEPKKESETQLINSRRVRDTNPKLRREEPTGQVVFSKSALTSYVIAIAASALIAAINSHYQKTLTLWVPIVGGIVGVLAAAILAEIFKRSSEFMEAEGDYRSYLRFLAYGITAYVPAFAIFGFNTSLKTIAAIGVSVGVVVAFWRKYHPLIEKFLFVGGGYVATLSFLFYLAGLFTGQNPAAPHKIHDVSTATSATTPTTQSTDPVASNVAERPQAVPSVQPPPQQQQPVATIAQQLPEPPLTTPSALPMVTQVISTAPAAAPTPRVIQTVLPTEVKRASNKPVRTSDQFMINQLYTAAKVGDINVVASLISEKRVSPNTATKGGVTALMLAAYNGHMNVLKYLISKKANVNIKDSQGTTALMWAAVKGRKDIINYLISKGAVVNVKRNDGDTAADIARRWSHSKVADLIEDAGSPRANRKMAKSKQRSSSGGMGRSLAGKKSSPTKTSRKKSHKKNSETFSSTED